MHTHNGSTASQVSASSGASMLDAPQVFVKQKGRSIMAEVSDDLLRQLLAQQVQARRSSGPTWFGFIALLFVLCGAGWWAASSLSIDGVPVGATVVPTIRASRVPPVRRDAPAVVVQTVLVPQATNTPVPPTALPVVVPTIKPTITAVQAEILKCDGKPFTIDASGRAWCLDSEATADAWVDAPVSTNTATPTRFCRDGSIAQNGWCAGGNSALQFQDAPECNVLIGYLGEDKKRCDAVYATQTTVAADD